MLRPFLKPDTWPCGLWRMALRFMAEEIFITEVHHEELLGSLFCRNLWIAIVSGGRGRSCFRTRGYLL
jgi:hypothetical protein